MDGLFFIDPDVTPSSEQLKLPYHPPKKYVLSKTIPINRKDSEIKFFDERLRKKDTKPEYFTNILKEQKKNMFVNTFLRKLKSTVVQKKMPEHKLLSQTVNYTEEDSMHFEAPKFVQNILLVISLLHAFSLLLFNSMALIFDEINNSQLFRDFMIISFLLHCLEIGSKFFIHIDYQENKITNIQEITNKYLKGEFWLDAMVLLGLIMYFAMGNNAEASFIFRVMIFGKVNSLMYIMEHLEITLIENEYREQIWSLIKVFLFNFIFAHILTLALVLMARIKENDNWIVSRGLEDAEWSERYIWAYYWATTIMLTVGFGDIVPRNSSEALSLIFIETMSCIVLAYNINRVGIIIQKIRSYEAEKNLHLKTFNHIKEKSEFSNETKTRIMNYIKESTEIKRNFNLGEEKEFIESLPMSFQSDLLKEMNRHVWNGMMFFQNLSEQTLVKLSITIEKKLAHPEEIVYARGNNIDVLVFNGGGFGYAYNNGNSTNNGRIMQDFKVPEDRYQIATLDFLIKNQLSYNIKCTEYSVVYKISTDQLVKILNNHSYDSEYFFMIKDKDKFLPNEFELSECEICKKERHSVFKCPKLHFIPLKEHVIRKYRGKYYPRIFRFVPNRSTMEKHRTLIKFKQNLKHIHSTRRFVSIYLQTLKSNEFLASQDFQSQNTFKDMILSSKKQLIQKNLNNENNLYAFHQQTSKLYQEAMDELRSKIDDIMQPTKFQWEIELDVAFNFKFYFRKYNSDQISHFSLKKIKSKVPIYRKTQVFGYKKTNKLEKIQENIIEMMAWKKKLLPPVRKDKKLKS